MIRGISCNIQSPDSFLLSKIFNNVDLSNYNWSVYNEQAWDISGQDLFPEKFYSGSEMSKLIKSPSELIMLLSMYAFNGEKIKIQNNYLDYFHSDCVLALFVVDVYDIEIYCKDSEVLEMITSNIKNNFMKFEYITDENDCRSGFPY